MDIHNCYCQVAILDDVTDSTDPEECRIPTERDELEGFAREYQGANVAFEAPRNYWYIYDCLNEYLDVTVANPRETGLIADQKVKSDRLGAKRLISEHTLSIYTSATTIVADPYIQLFVVPILLESSQGNLSRTSTSKRNESVDDLRYSSSFAVPEFFSGRSTVKVWVPDSKVRVWLSTKTCSDSVSGLQPGPTFS